jgi:bifunctional DNA primase/polymerase-like protein/primase-like protein
MLAPLRERPPDEEESPVALADAHRASPVQRSPSSEDREQDTKESPVRQTGAFAAAAEWWWKQGFAPIPLGGPKGNEPHVKGFTRWKHRPALASIRKWAEKWPDANIGIVTGPTWRLTVLDVDDPKILGAMLKRFGESPLWVDTPRGGTHLYYRSNGEECPDLRKSEGLNADVKGKGGIIVAPPSVRPSGEFAGRAYRLVAGCSWAALASLPTIKEGALPPPPSATVTPLRAVASGHRNNTLFKLLLREAGRCSCAAELVEIARTIFSAQFEPGDFTDGEIVKTARSAWGYQATGRNWAGKASRSKSYTAATVERLNPDAFYMLAVLKLAHQGKRETFALMPDAMEKADTIPGWSRHRYRACRNRLVDAGDLVMIKEGGNGKNTPALFAFSSS